MTTQEEREARIMAWADRTNPTVQEIFGEEAEITRGIREGDLQFVVSVKKPLKDRPNAHGLLHIRVSREALDDYLLREHVGDIATRAFLTIVREKQKSYSPV